MEQHTLANIPTEIHHEILSYLDYVRDICAHPLLFVPEAPEICTREEFENLMDCDEEIDLHLPSEEPLFIICKSMLESIKSYKPSTMNINFFDSHGTCGNDVFRSMFDLDQQYLVMLTKYKWLNVRPPTYQKMMAQDWMEEFMRFTTKMKKLCKCDPFKRVEVLMFSKHFGKNYFLDCRFHSFEKYLPQIGKILPNVKYYHTNVEISDNARLGGDKILISICNTSNLYPGLLRSGNIYKNCERLRNNAVSMEIFMDSIPKKFHRNIELILFYCLSCSDITNAANIIDNYPLNINHFFHILAIHPNHRHIYTINSIAKTIAILSLIYQKYPKFKLFKFPITSPACIAFITKAPFIEMTVARNLTRDFFTSTISTNYISKFCNENNVDLSNLGKLKFSVASLEKDYFKISSTSLDPNSQDKLGISPCMILIDDYNPTGVQHDIKLRDNFGNNILHYYLSNSYDWERKSSYNQVPCLTENSEEELIQLLDQNNDFGVCAKEISFSRRSNRTFDNSKKLFNYNNFVRTCGYCLFNLILFDGLQIDMIMLEASRNNFRKEYNYNDYKDIKYRDENGKHLVHYFSNCFKNEETLRNLQIHISEVVYCKDINETMPIQTCSLDYHTILMELFSLNLPNINIVSYTDKFGMYRIQYLMITQTNLNFLFTEFNTIAFDYSTSTPQLISLNCNFIGKQYHFSLEKSDLKQLNNVSFFGSKDGDDFSHWVLRYCIYKILNDPNYKGILGYLYLFLKVFIKKGLRFDVVRNTEGKTAFDILCEFKPTTELVFVIKRMKHICRKGLKKDSKAQQKFSLKCSQEYSNIIIEQSETKIVTTSCLTVKVVRSLYFNNSNIKK